MKTSIKATNIELTSSIRSYVEDKLSHLDNMVEKYNDSSAQVEVGKITRHHKSGEVFFAEINLHMDGKLFREVVDAEDLYAAIDQAKDKMHLDIGAYIKKNNRLLRRGGQMIKRFLRRPDTE